MNANEQVKLEAKGRVTGMLRYFLGVDVGASKSHALITDETGQALSLSHAAGANTDEVGYDGLQRMLSVLVRKAVAGAGIQIEQISGSGFGVAGYDWPSQYSAVKGSILAAGIPEPIEIYNDALIGLLAGSEQGWGVVVSAGTSGNAWGRGPDGRLGRMLGFGLRFAEGAGAIEMVQKGIMCIAREWTQRGPATSLTRRFAEIAGAADADELLEGLACHRIRIPATAALAIFEEAGQGDAVAASIIVWAGRELGDLANGIIRQLGLEEQEFEVVLSGSTFNGSPVLAQALQNEVLQLAPHARLVRLSAPPVVGAALLGMQQGGLDHRPPRKRLVSSTMRLLGQETAVGLEEITKSE
jgi:N-acetylglucosamine kinase-like BadF-type ATPase